MLNILTFLGFKNCYILNTGHTFIKLALKLHVCVGMLTSMLAWDAVKYLYLLNDCQTR